MAIDHVGRKMKEDYHVETFFKKVVNFFEVDLKDRNKNEKFYKSMKQLVTILFAIVFGVGLSQLGEVKGNYDLFILALAYLAVLLSWWGYHLATIIGPSETNVLTYLIDCGLLVVYWYLINVRSPLTYVLILYGVMFLLYFLWELVRYNKEERSSQNKSNIKNAIALVGDKDKKIVVVTNRYHLARVKQMSKGFGLKVELCAAEDKLKLNIVTLLKLMLEALHVHWYLSGHYYAHLTNNNRIINRLG